MPLRIGIMYCHHLTSCMMWTGTKTYPHFGEPPNSSSRQARKMKPALITWEANCSFPIKDSSCLQDILDLLHQDLSSACISSTHAGDIEMVMSIVLNIMPNTTMSDEGGQALCSDSHMPMSCHSHPN